MRKVLGKSPSQFRPVVATVVPAILSLLGCSSAPSPDSGEVLSSSASPLGTCSVSLSASVASATAAVGNRIAFAATATNCGTAPIYRFSVTNVDGSTYTMRRNYSTRDHFEWAPMVEGTYGVRVEVKDAYTSATARASTSVAYQVSKAAGTSDPCAIAAAASDDGDDDGGGLEPPSVSSTPHPLVKLLSVPSCEGARTITTQVFDVTAGAWKNAETRSCFAPEGAEKTQNFLIGGVRPDENNNICVRYRANGRHSPAVGATLGPIPSSIRVPLTMSIPTGNESLSNADYSLQFLGTTSRIFLDMPEAAIGGPCCDASATCTGTKCCSDPSKGPTWQTVAQKQKNCWAAPTAVDATDGKLLWYFSQTTLGSRAPGGQNEPFSFSYYNMGRLVAANSASHGEIDRFAPSILTLGQDDEGRKHDTENVSSDVFRQIDIAGNPLWETNVYAVNARLPKDFNFVGFHHDEIAAANGDVVLVGYSTRCLPHLGPGTAVSGTTHPCPTDANGVPQQKWLSDAIVVLDRDGNVKWSWNVWDHQQPGEIPRTRRPRAPDSKGHFGSYVYCLNTTGADATACKTATGELDPLLCPGVSAIECPVKFANEITHTNDIFLDRDGNLIVSLRYQALLVKLDMQYPSYAGDGSLQWKLGQCKDNESDPDDPLCFKTGDGDQATQGMSPNWFSFQHDANVLQNGEIVMHDNGNVKCRTDWYDPVANACLNGWTDCVASYQKYDPTTCPFASRAQWWHLNTDAMTANPTARSFSFPQLDNTTRFGTPPASAFSDRVGAAQQLPGGGWYFDVGALQYTGGNQFIAQMTEYGCADSGSDDGDDCTLTPVRALETNHLVYRSHRAPNLYYGVPGYLGRGSRFGVHQDD